MSKRLLVAGVLLSVLVLGGSVSLASTLTEYKGFPVARVLVNGRQLESDVPPVIMDGRTLLPVRAVSEALGVTVGWEESTQTVTLTAPPVIKPGPSYLWIAGEAELGTALSTFHSWADRYDGIVVQGNDGGILVHSIADLRAYIGGEVSIDQYIGKGTVYSRGQPALTPTPSPPPPPATLDKVIVVAQDEEYLGEFSSNEFAVESICNQFGTYGSKFSVTSIWNEFSIYGSAFSDFSAFNDLATQPPMLIGQNDIVGYLTTNSTVVGAISPHGICQRLKDAGF